MVLMCSSIVSPSIMVCVQNFFIVLHRLTVSVISYRVVNRVQAPREVVEDFMFSMTILFTHLLIVPRIILSIKSHVSTSSSVIAVTAATVEEPVTLSRAVGTVLMVLPGVNHCRTLLAAAQSSIWIFQDSQSSGPLNGSCSFRDESLAVAMEVIRAAWAFEAIVVYAELNQDSQRCSQP